MRFRLRYQVSFLVAFALGTSAIAQSFTGVGDLSGGAFNSSARSVSAGGDIVVGVSASGASSSQAFRWTPDGGIQSLPWFGQAQAISLNGRVVVGTVGINDPRQAVCWTQTDGAVPLGFLHPDHTRSDAFAVNADGSVIVGASGAFNVAPFEAFRWTQAAGMAGLGIQPGYTNSRATGVSADGSIVVGSSYLTGGGAPWQAFRWAQSTGLVGLGFLSGHNASGAAAISADGSTIIGSSFTAGVVGSTPFRWTEANGMESLGTIAGYSTFDPLSVNGDGSIVVGTCYSGSTTRAFIWTSTYGMRLLSNALPAEYGISAEGWLLIMAFSISADGRAIAGYGLDPIGNPQGWVAVLSPQPCERCDLNCDGSVNQFDIQPFIETIVTHSGCSPCAGDTDANGTANAFDINGFIECLVP